MAAFCVYVRRRERLEPGQQRVQGHSGEAKHGCAATPITTNAINSGAACAGIHSAISPNDFLIWPESSQNSCIFRVGYWKRLEMHQKNCFGLFLDIL